MQEPLKSLIKQTAINSILQYFKKNLNRKRKFQILDLLIPREREIRSIVGGLETSLGRTLWEPLAKEIARANGFNVINKNLEAAANMPGSLASTIQVIIEARENQNNIYNGTSSHDAIRNICQQFINSPITHFIIAPVGSGVDVWLQKDGVDYFFDTKTVQPNIGDLKKYLRQILNWYGYYYSRSPRGTAVARIVFPYNPYHPADFWKSTKARGRPLEQHNEAWVEDEFWDFISGTPNTFQIIKDAFTEIFNEKTLEIELGKLFKIDK